jgi:hypothetical protein
LRASTTIAQRLAVKLPGMADGESGHESAKAQADFLAAIAARDNPVSRKKVFLSTPILAS